MISSRKSLFHPARFNLLRIEVFFLSTPAMLRAIRRIMAMFSSSFPSPCPLPVLIHGCIRNRMRGVLNSPVGPYPGQKHRRIQGAAQQETPGLGSGIALDMPLGFQRSSGHQTGPVMPFTQPVNVAADANPTGFNTTMTFFNNIG